MYRNEILNGINFLKSIQNKDGGIPAMKETGSSACWTTAEALEAVLMSPYISMEHHDFIFGMINYLLNNQMNEPNNMHHDGAWPEYTITSTAQTLTTGHALSALRLAENIIVDNTEIQSKIRNAIAKGFIYLNHIQNSDGGWGIEPECGGEEKESRLLGTVFVLRGYIQNGFNANNSTAVRKACNYLLSLRDTKTGGFSKTPGDSPDVCYTARAISVLIRAKVYTNKDSVIKQALKFIYRDKSLKELFKVKHDPYVSENSSGMVVFHSNTPIDVMEALCLCKVNNRRIKRLEQWILQTQEDRGGWYLAGSQNPEKNEGVISWTTNEAIYALICADKAYSDEYYIRGQKKLRFYKKISFTLGCLATILLFTPSIVSHENFIINFWNGLSLGVRQFIAVSVFGGLTVNLFSNSIFEWIKKIIKGGENN